MPPRSLSTSTNLLLRTNDNTSDMENKENMIRQLQWGQKTVIYSQVYLRKLSQYGKNGYKQGKGMQKWKLKQLFLYVWEIMRDTCTSWCTRRHSFLRHSLLRCPQMLRCPWPHTQPTNELRMEKQACSRPCPLERYHFFKLGHLSHTQLCAAECLLCVFTTSGVLS